jgi:hypothetical protein
MNGQRPKGGTMLKMKTQQEINEIPESKIREIFFRHQDVWFKDLEALQAKNCRLVDRLLCVSEKIEQLIIRHEPLTILFGEDLMSDPGSPTPAPGDATAGVDEMLLKKHTDGQKKTYRWSNHNKHGGFFIENKAAVENDEEFVKYGDFQLWISPPYPVNIVIGHGKGQQISFKHEDLRTLKHIVGEAIKRARLSLGDMREEV